MSAKRANVSSFQPQGHITLTICHFQMKLYRYFILWYLYYWQTDHFIFGHVKKAQLLIHVKRLVSITKCLSRSIYDKKLLNKEMWRWTLSPLHAYCLLDSEGSTSEKFRNNKDIHLHNVPFKLLCACTIYVKGLLDVIENGRNDRLVGLLPSCIQ